MELGDSLRRRTSGMASFCERACSHLTSTSMRYLMSAYSLKYSLRSSTCMSDRGVLCDVRCKEASNGAVKIRNALSLIHI